MSPWRALLVTALLLVRPAQAADDPLPRWHAQAARVTITRDEWGIAHVHGRSDADAVFGLIYAQAEDDFHRIEVNLLTALGRTAEASGEGAIWADLRQRLYLDPDDLRRQYATSPGWLRGLMQAWADGLNFYLATHPDVRPQVLTRFEPWMSLSFTEGSIGGDIEQIPLDGVRAFYDRHEPPPPAPPPPPREPGGSNGIVIAPRLTADGHALLLINPHTSFYFRSEAQMNSDTGLDVYGASTWGQFFIYQGFNAHAGWMHTSSTVDNIDEFSETIVDRGGRFAYRYGDRLRELRARQVRLAFRRDDGGVGHRDFTVYATHHGPITRAESGHWIATALMNRPVAALEQSWLRTKARGLDEFMKIAELRANSSNDTLFADDRGEIAFLMPQFMPVRDDRFDYTRPVDGADPATDWRGLHSIVSLPNVIAPKTGWAHNTNDWPWDAAGVDSPKARDYPRYMDQSGANPRGAHADLLLRGKSGWTLEKLRDAAFDSYLPGFAMLVPKLVADWSALAAGDPRRTRLAEPIALLRDWDDRWSTESEATSLAVVWGERLWEQIGPQARAAHLSVADYIDRHVAPQARLDALSAAVDRLTADFGDWRVKWREINRFQRLDDSIVPHFDDAKPSVPVPFVSAQWGSLASFGAKRWPGTKRWYGTSGNSFVAIVEFGPKVRAKAVMAGGQSGDPASPHFADQIGAYANGALRDIDFEPGDISRHAVSVYHPG